MISNKDLMTKARQDLSGKWLQSVLVVFIWIIFGLVFSVLDRMITSMIFSESFVETDYPISIFGFFLGSIVYFGVINYFLNLVRKQDIKVGQLFYGFKHITSVLILHIFVTIIVIFSFLLFIIPGIIMTLKYSMVWFILRDNPNMKTKDVLDMSASMMNGYKKKLFLMRFRFVGWGLLSILTCGIGFLWVSTYYHTTLANFYEDVKADLERTSVVEVEGEVAELGYAK